MSLTNIAVMKETISLGSYEDEWIHNSMISISPFGDFIVVSSSKCAVFYIKKFVSTKKEDRCNESEPSDRYKKSRAIFQIARTYSPLCETSGEITSVSYLPVKSVSSNGLTHDMLHCVVIGYATGLVEVIAGESGDVLLSKQFSKHGNEPNSFSVTSIEYLSTHSNSNTSANRSQNSYLTNTLVIPKLQELLIVMGTTIATLDSLTLYSTLIKSKAEISAARTNGRNVSTTPTNVTFKRYNVKEQKIVVGAVAYSVPNISLDQYHQLSMDKELVNEQHLRTPRYITTYVTIGADPFIQHNCPYQLGPQNINELAANVVSTVKSGIFRAASGFIGSWTGATPTENDEVSKQQDPEQTLHRRHAFKDNTKKAVSIKLSPDGKYSAVIDEQNRVLLLDNCVNGSGSSSGTVIHVWKGYHHAEVGWITTSWEDKKLDKCNRVPKDLEISVLLVLYLPRRGLLEIWSPEQMYRVVEFPVGKNGKLLSCSNAILDESNQSNSMIIRKVDGCVFLEPSGSIKHIYVPVHSLTSKSSSHDTVVKNQILTLAASDMDVSSNVMDNLSTPMEVESTFDTTGKIIQLILSAQSTIEKIDMVVELFLVWKTPDSTNQRIVLNSVATQLSESDVARERCSILDDLITFYEMLVKYGSFMPIGNKKPDEGSQKLSIDSIRKIIKCSNKEANDLINVCRNNIYTHQKPKCRSNAASNPFYFSSFFACFDLKYNTFGALADNKSSKDLRIKLKSKSTNLAMNMMCRSIAKTCSVVPQEITEFMISKKIADGFTLIHHLLQTSIQFCNLESEESLVEWVENNLDSSIFVPICNLGFSLHESNGDGSSFQALVQGARQILIKNNSISVATYTVTLAWKSFLSGGMETTMDKRFSSCGEEWQHALFLMEGFIAVAAVANKKLLHTEDDEKSVPTYTVQDVFNSGNGKISETFVQWLLDKNITCQDVIEDECKDQTEEKSSSSMDVEICDKLSENEGSFGEKLVKKEVDFKKFMATSKEYFPMSSQKDIIICHMAWEYLYRWDKNHGNLDLLINGALPCISHIPLTWVQHRLTALAWTTFLSKTVIEAVNLTENRSASRCEREIGLQETQLSCFLDAAARLLRLLVDTAELAGSNDSKNFDKLHYDDVALLSNIHGGTGGNKQHLMDYLRGKIRSSDIDVISIQYQYVVVASAIWRFGIDSIKPLSLFNSQESNLFFQGLPSSSAFISSTAFQNLIFQSEHSRSVRHARRRFLEAACDGAVSSIHHLPDGELDCTPYDVWSNTLMLIAKMWHLAEKHREIQIVSLYRAGHDTLGTELMNLLPDRTSVGHKLLHVCLLRLSKYIYFGGIDSSNCPQGEAKAKIAAVGITNANLTRQLNTIKNEASKSLSVETSLKDTSDLLILLSGLELEEQSQQLAYECLALTQSLKT